MKYRFLIMMLVLITCFLLFSGCQTNQQSNTQASEIYSRALHLYQQGKLEEAKVLFETGMKEDPQNGMYAFYLGNIYRKQEDMKKAAQHYQLAIAKSPKIIEAYNNLTALLMTMDRYDEALQTATKGLVQQPDHADLKFKKAQLLYVKNQYNVAIPLLSELANDPNYFEAHRFLGLYYMKENKKKKALEHFTLYLKQAPEGVPNKEEVKQHLKRMLLTK